MLISCFSRYKLRIYQPTECIAVFIHSNSILKFYLLNYKYAPISFEISEAVVLIAGSTSENCCLENVKEGAVTDSPAIKLFS